MTSAGAERLALPLPWLSQGDIFASVPVLDVAANAQDRPAPWPLGPALLATHDCSLDKKTGPGMATVECLSLLPLRSTSVLPGHRVRLLRRETLQPYEVMYLGDVPGVGDAYVRLSEPYPLPATHFAVRIRMFESAPAGHDAGAYLVADAHGERLARLDGGALELFRSKWNVLWTRRLDDTSPG